MLEEDIDDDELDENIENDELDRIYIEPPEVGVESDEDSADEDEAGLVDNLSGRQLRAGAIACFRNGNRIGEQDLLPANSDKKKKKKLTWDDKDIDAEQLIFPEPNYSEYKNKTPTELFEIFFNDNVWALLVSESSRYALFLNQPDPKITIEEFKVFIGILILSGYNELPSQRMYWDSEDDTKNVLVTNSMRRDRFLQIKRFIHFVDNNNSSVEDKMWKLRPFMNILQAQFMKNFQPQKNLSYDESMIAYYGKHGCKQFIRGKPIRFGFKVWSLNTTEGYLLNFDVYQGKNVKSNAKYEVSLGKCATPLAIMIDDLPDSKKHLPYYFYFDNLFTSVNLLTHLKEHGYRGTGTIRENRIDKSCPLSNSKSFKKNPRGTIEFVRIIEENIIMVRWLDNNVVTIASNAHGSHPTKKTPRYSRAAHKVIDVQQPNVFSKYNKCMGGTDQMDQNINNYRISIRGKKWWWPIFTWFVDAAIQNAWLLSQKTNQAKSQINFRRSIVQTYLKKYGKTSKGGGRPKISEESSINSRVSDGLRLDTLQHLVRFIPDGKRRRCAGANCSSIVRTECKKCNIGLCINCFEEFHVSM